MRSTRSGGTLAVRPMRTPCALFTASASFVRCPMIRRSHWATDISTLATSSPFGVVVSMPKSRTTIRQPLRRARSMSVAKSTIERDSRSSIATTRTPSSARSTSRSASARAGRRRSVPPLAPASSWMAVRLHARRSHSAVIVDRCTSRPARDSACSSVETRTQPTAVVLSGTDNYTPIAGLVYSQRPLLRSLGRALTPPYRGGQVEISPHNEVRQPPYLRSWSSTGAESVLASAAAATAFAVSEPALTEDMRRRILKEVVWAVTEALRLHRVKTSESQGSRTSRAAPPAHRAGPCRTADSPVRVQERDTNGPLERRPACRPILRWVGGAAFLRSIAQGPMQQSSGTRFGARAQRLSPAVVPSSRGKRSTRASSPHRPQRSGTRPLHLRWAWEPCSNASRLGA